MNFVYREFRNRYACDMDAEDYLEVITTYEEPEELSTLAESTSHVRTLKRILQIQDLFLHTKEALEAEEEEEEEEEDDGEQDAEMEA